MSADLAASVGLVALCAAVALAYGVRVAMRGSARHERVERAGASPLLGRSSMEAAYWALGPIASALVALGVSANAITVVSVLLGLGAGVLLATGHFGLAAAATMLASLADALDGLVARADGSASDAGEVLDAAADRYVEMFFLGGLAVLVRDDAASLVVVLAALLGSFMVSYSTAKAEALQLPAPRGAMRRAERAVVLLAGALLTPFAAAYAQSHDAGPRAAMSPMLAAVGLVALVANVSAVGRLRALMVAVRARGPQGATSSAPDSSRDRGVAARRRPT